MRERNRPTVSHALTETTETVLAQILTGRAFAALALVVFALFVVSAWRSGQLDRPLNTMGDEPEYDNIACNLRASGSFAFDHRDPAFLAPYVRAAKAGNGDLGYPERVADRPSGPTTYRPPVLPLLLAATYGDDLSVRSYRGIRLLNLASAALTVALVGWLCRRAVGAVPSVLSVALVLGFGRVQEYGCAILTESLSGLLATGALATLVLLTPKRTMLSAVVLGAVWAAAILTRTSAVLWVPALALGLWVLSRGSATAPRPFRARATSVLVYLATTGALVLPWSVRNCQVLGAFMPLGCQGYVELPTGFSDAAVQNKGVWFARDQDAEMPRARPGAPEFERTAAEEGRKLTLDWVRANPSRLPGLTANKLWSEWKPRSTSAAFIVFAALVGFGCVRGSSFGWGCFALILGDCLMVAATWSVEGRFTYPALAAVYGAAGVGCWALVCLVVAFRHDIPGALATDPNGPDGAVPVSGAP